MPSPIPSAERLGFDDNCGVQTILFRPGTGESARVHFRPGPTRVAMGELAGDE